MDLVTLTDHDSIAGGLEILDRPGVFLSEEVTARFPDNGCDVHVLVWDLHPDQHGRIQEIRQDIYALVDYLRDQRLAHALAHPLYAPNQRMDRDTLERAILLFAAFETLNGLLDARIEDDLNQLLAGLDEAAIARLEARHGQRAHGDRPDRKAVTAGSDDHANRRSGTVHTAVPGAGLSPRVFLAAVMAGEGRPQGRHADLNTMGSCSLRTTSEFLRRRDRTPSSSDSDPVTDLVEAVLGEVPRGAMPGFLRPVIAGLTRRPRLVSVAQVPGEAHGCGSRAASPAASVTELDAADATLVHTVARSVDTACGAALDGVLDATNTLDVYALIDSARDLACALAAGAPYLFAARHFADQYASARAVRRDWIATKVPAQRKRLAVFSDSLDQVDGVSTWCQRFMAEAEAYGCDVLVPYCGDRERHPDGQRFHALPAIRSFPVPFYAQIQLYVPSLLRTVDWMWRERVSNVELATPGPMGMVGLLAAKLLRLPVTASYHTELPALLASLAGDALLVGLSRKYLAWFYSRADVAFVYADRAKQRLIELGVDEGRIEVLPVTVNPDHFDPRLGSASVFRELGIELDGRAPVLSVGRLSPEKNVPMIVEAVRRLQSAAYRPMLVVAGEGPEGETLRRLYEGEPFVRFVGLQRGERLRRLYASARAFVFASRVDTLGLVNLEAMASGVPVVMPADASAADLAREVGGEESGVAGVSAELYPHGVQGLTEALARVLGDPAYASRLGANARRAMVSRWTRHPFTQVWESFTRAS